MSLQTTTKSTHPKLWFQLLLVILFVSLVLLFHQPALLVSRPQLILIFTTLIVTHLVKQDTIQTLCFLFQLVQSVTVFVRLVQTQPVRALLVLRAAQVLIFTTILVTKLV